LVVAGIAGIVTVRVVSVVSLLAEDGIVVGRVVR
jgi:hypothetical protein